MVARVRRRRTRMRFYPKRLIFNLLLLAGFLMILWFVYSCFQAVIHNVDGLSGTSYAYPNWNIFVFTTNLF